MYVYIDIKCFVYNSDVGTSYQQKWKKTAINDKRIYTRGFRITINLVLSHIST